MRSERVLGEGGGVVGGGELGAFWAVLGEGGGVVGGGELGAFWAGRGVVGGLGGGEVGALWVGRGVRGSLRGFLRRSVNVFHFKSVNIHLRRRNQWVYIYRTAVLHFIRAWWESLGTRLHVYTCCTSSVRSSRAV